MELCITSVRVLLNGSTWYLKTKKKNEGRNTRVDLNESCFLGGFRLFPKPR